MNYSQRSSQQNGIENLDWFSSFFQNDYMETNYKDEIQVNGFVQGMDHQNSIKDEQIKQYGQFQNDIYVIQEDSQEYVLKPSKNNNNSYITPQSKKPLFIQMQPDLKNQHFQQEIEILNQNKHLRSNSSSNSSFYSNSSNRQKSRNQNSRGSSNRKKRNSKHRSSQRIHSQQKKMNFSQNKENNNHVHEKVIFTNQQLSGRSQTNKKQIQTNLEDSNNKKNSGIKSDKFQKSQNFETQNINKLEENFNSEIDLNEHSQDESENMDYQKIDQQNMNHSDQNTYITQQKQSNQLETKKQQSEKQNIIENIEFVKSSQNKQQKQNEFMKDIQMQNTIKQQEIKLENINSNQVVTKQQNISMKPLIQLNINNSFESNLSPNKSNNLSTIKKDKHPQSPITDISVNQLDNSITNSDSFFMNPKRFTSIMKSQQQSENKKEILINLIESSSKKNEYPLIKFESHLKKNDLSINKNVLSLSERDFSLNKIILPQNKNENSFNKNEQLDSKNQAEFHKKESQKIVNQKDSNQLFTNQIQLYQNQKSDKIFKSIGNNDFSNLNEFKYQNKVQNNQTTSSTKTEEQKSEKNKTIHNQQLNTKINISPNNLNDKTLILNQLDVSVTQQDKSLLNEITQIGSSSQQKRYKQPIVQIKISNKKQQDLPNFNNLNKNTNNQKQSKSLSLQFPSFDIKIQKRGEEKRKPLEVEEQSLLLINNQHIQREIKKLDFNSLLKIDTNLKRNTENQKLTPIINDSSQIHQTQNGKQTVTKSNINDLHLPNENNFTLNKVNQSSIELNKITSKSNKNTFELNQNTFDMTKTIFDLPKRSNINKQQDEGKSNIPQQEIKNNIQLFDFKVNTPISGINKSTLQLKQIAQKSVYQIEVEFNELNEKLDKMFQYQLYFKPKGKSTEQKWETEFLFQQQVNINSDIININVKLNGIQ